MKFGEIELFASKNEEMPDGLNQTEQLCFLSLRALYNDIRKGNILKEQASREKRAIKIRFEKQTDINDFNYKMHKNIQLSLRRGNELKTEINKMFELEFDERSVLIRCLECIAKLSNERTFFDNNIKYIQGYDNIVVDNPRTEIEVEETND